MRRFALAIFPLLFTAALAAPNDEPGADAAEAEAHVRRGEQVSVLRSIHVRADEIVLGEVVCIGCDAVIEGVVEGDVVVIGGSMRFSGRTEGNLVSVMSSLELTDDAVIDGEFVNVLGGLEDAGAAVGDARIQIAPILRHGITSFLLWWRVVRSLAVFFVLLLLALLVPDRIRAISEEVPLRYGTAILAGIGGYVLLWVVSALLIVSVLGIPFALVLHPVFLVLKVLGLAGLFCFIGQRFGRSIGQEMSLLGAILIVFLPFGFLLVLPHFFGLWGLLFACAIRLGVWVLVDLPAVGLVLLTRGGGRRWKAPAEPVSSVVLPMESPPAGV